MKAVNTFLYNPPIEFYKALIQKPLHSIHTLHKIEPPRSARRKGQKTVRVTRAASTAYNTLSSVRVEHLPGHD